MIARDQQHEAEMFFTEWTPEHTGWLIVVVIGLIVFWRALR